MIKLNLPEHQFKLKKKEGKIYVFDELRKKYLVLTPEEWVRQNFLQFLIQNKNYPKGRIAIETGLKVNDLPKRSDALIYDQNGKVLMVIECKASSVQITEETFSQAARYNTYYKAPFLLVTNGLNHYCSKINFEEKSFEHLPGVPDYSSIETSM